MEQPLEHEGISQADLDRVQEIIRLRVVNDKLLEALEGLVMECDAALRDGWICGEGNHSEACQQARDAIQEAKK